MPIINRVAEFHDDMTAWRHDLHTHPETAFEEQRTAEFVAKKLESFGIEVHRGLAKTGVVGTLKVGDSKRAIGLRADMDALDLQELNDFEYRSAYDGKMHACGHDGHTTMLLGAARYLAETRNFDGTVHFIFQPAEENVAGGRVMVEEGLFEKFPVQDIYGMHNMPGTPVGKVVVRKGPMMASADFFEVIVTGKGVHGAMPHLGIDPVVIAAQIVGAWQGIVSRSADPLQAAVISVTQIHGGHTSNVIPEEVTLSGTTRAFLPEMQDMIERRLKQVADGICAAHGATCTFEYSRRYPSVINTDHETDIAARAAAEVVGSENVLDDEPPTMGAEDFAWMLQTHPGSYIWIGNGVEGEAGGCAVHNPHYDFNDDILAIGASYWAQLVHDVLEPGAAA